MNWDTQVKCAIRKLTCASHNLAKMVCVLTLECIFGVAVQRVFMDVSVMKLRPANHDLVNVGHVLPLPIRLHVDARKRTRVVTVRIRLIRVNQTPVNMADVHRLTIFSGVSVIKDILGNIAR